jgi:dihydrofolate reductase
MGRKTFDSIGKVLEKRTNIIISKNKNLKIKDALVVSNFDDALKACKPGGDIFIIGGSKIYEIAMEYSQYLLLTIIHKEFEGDTFFPKFDRRKWRLIDETRNYDIENKFSYSYLTFKSQ